jgi:uncharacterized protein YbjQ (UPF0145 family)
MSWKCENCGEHNDEEVHKSCWKCNCPRNGTIEDLNRSVTCSTTDQIPGREILESKGLVFGEAIMGANIIRDFVAGVSDIVGGRSGVYESKLREGRDIAINEMLLDARTMKADAVVGIDIDYKTVGQSMLMICATGTAVALKPIE